MFLRLILIKKIKNDLQLFMGHQASCLRIKKYYINPKVVLNACKEKLTCTKVKNLVKYHTSIK
jgi:hypothetical protein